MMTMKEMQTAIADLRTNATTLDRDVRDARREVGELRAQLASQKPFWKMKGAMGPLASIAALGAMVVGYIQNWPADAMAILTAIAGGGGVTGIIGRLQREGRVVAAPRPPEIIETVSPRLSRTSAAVGVLLALAGLTGALWPVDEAWAMTRYTVTTTHYDDQGNATHTTTEEVSKKVMEARERHKTFKVLAEQSNAQREILARALPPPVERPEMLDPQAQRDYMAWGRDAGYIAANIRMAEALDPETTSALQAGKEIELASINRGL